jgi:hypothetical protein
MDKTVEARVGISTDTRVEGRYFVDVRDTTNGRDRQMTTRVTDDPLSFIRDLTAEGIRQGVSVTYVDNTGEMAE